MKYRFDLAVYMYRIGEDGVTRVGDSLSAHRSIDFEAETLDTVGELLAKFERLCDAVKEETTDHAT